MNATGEMVWHRRLRWRLVGIQLLGVLIGVGIMIVATQLILARTAPQIIRPNLLQLLQNPDGLGETERILLDGYRNAVYSSVLVAAAAATAAAVAAGLLFWRMLAFPLRRIAVASRRIADGRYSERVDVVGVGEAMQLVVDNFNQMADALERTEETRVTMIGNVAHELRTPLTGLRGYVEGLEDGVFKADSATFSLLGREIGRLTRLVDDLQALSRVEAGAIQLTFHDFDLAELVRHLVTQFQPQAHQANLKLLLSPSQAVPVHADRDRAAQVVTNLISNALRYTPEGGTIAVSTTAQQNEALVQVQDNGIGISAEQLPLIFERFYRVDESRARRAGDAGQQDGAGVGLTIARHLAWAMGGELSAASAGPGHGSTFSFSLPLAPERNRPVA